jgi:hypothetical protein
MKKFSSVMFAWFIVVVAIPAIADEQGRPDPTGQGRYLQFGHESSYSSARVIQALPTGAACAPAGEMIGARVWNSTREGFAILSELTDKAQIAVTNDGIFLCQCARGYNQLFRISAPAAPVAASPATPPPPAPVVTPAVTPNPVNINIDVNVDEEEEEEDSHVTSRDTCPNIRGLQSSVPRGRVLDDNGDCVRQVSWTYRNRYRLATAAAIAAATAEAARRCLFWWQQ